MKVTDLTNNYETFNELIKKQVAIVRRTCSMTNEDYEDCVQESWLALIKATKTYDETRNDNFKAYASAVANKATLNYMERKIYAHTTHIANFDLLEDDINREEFILNEEKNPVSKIVFEEFDQIEKLCFVAKEHKQKTVRLAAKAMILKSQGYKYKEIASMLDSTEDRLFNYVSRHKKTIQELIA